MGTLHTSFASGNMFTAGSDYGDTGTSGLNEFTNRINVESGILGTVSGASYAVSGAYVATSGAGCTVSGAYAATSGACYAVSGAGYAVSGAYVATSGAGYAVSGAYNVTSGTHASTLYAVGPTVTIADGATVEIVSGLINIQGTGSLFVTSYASIEPVSAGVPFGVGEITLYDGANQLFSGTSWSSSGATEIYLTPKVSGIGSISTGNHWITLKSATWLGSATHRHATITAFQVQ